MAFVDQQRGGVRLKAFVFKRIWLDWVPHLCTKYFSLFVLHDTAYPGRDAFTASSVPLNQQFEKVFVTEQLFFERNLPDTVSEASHFISFVFLPVIKCTDKIDSCGIRGPFAEHPPLVGFMQTEVQIAGSHLGQRLFPVVGQALFLVNHVLIPSFYRLFIRGKPRVILY